MSRKEKLIARLRARPKDFTWRELETLLNCLGYTQVKSGSTGGSRRRFAHATAPPIILHQPHPSNELKAYQVDAVIESLSQEGLI
ncbi:MAG: type II toxin-antitoxin system HicA family toxin [Trueperaceae bacterium]|nr:type II toxin-antitoxin system HicA family toxin [Trueperaceae bacterium]